MCSPWIRLTSANRLLRKSTARPDAMIVTSCCSATRCSRTTRDRIACPMPSPVTPYRIFIARLRGALGELLVDHLLRELGIGAIAVLLLDRADHAARHLGIARRRLADRLGHRLAQLGLAQLLGQKLAAP